MRWRLALVLGALTAVGVAHAQDQSGQPGPLNTASVLSYQVAPTGAAVAMLPGKSVLVLSTTTTAASQTVLLPPNPMDGQIIRISSKATITALTVQDATGVQVGSAVALTALMPGNLFIYIAASGWVKIA